MKLRLLAVAVTVMSMCAGAGQTMASLWQDFNGPVTTNSVGPANFIGGTLGYIHFPTASGFCFSTPCSFGATGSIEFSFQLPGEGDAGKWTQADGFNIMWDINQTTWKLDDFSIAATNDAGNVLGAGGTIPLGPSLDGVLFDIGFSGPDEFIPVVVDVIPNHVPVPAAFPLFAVALAGLGFIARRKKQAA